MKLLGKMVLVLFLLIIAASVTLWLLARNIQPEAIKQLVNNQITTLTHKKSHIDGEASWQLFPRPGLKFTSIRIGDEHSAENYSVAIDTLLLNLKITPLLRGAFVFSEINIDGIKMQINRDAPSVITSDKEPTDPKNSSFGIDEHFALKKFLLKHGQITIRKNERVTVFKNLRFGIEQFNLQRAPFPIQIKTSLSDISAYYKIKGQINFTGSAKLSPVLITDLDAGINKSFIEGQLIAQNSSFNQLAIKKISTTLKKVKGALVFNPFTLSLYNGESIGNLQYTLANQQLSLNQTAINLNGKQLISDLFGKEIVSGNLDYSIHSTQSMTEPDIKHMTSKGSITIKNGTFYNLKLENLSNDTQLDPQNSQQSIHLSNQGNTSFQLASVQYQLLDGIMSSDSLLLQTEKLQMKGTGVINLSNHKINAKIQTASNANDLTKIIKKVQLLLGGYFPVVISGTLEKPIILPDFKIINPLLEQLLVKNPLKKGLQDGLGKLKERL